MNLTILLKDLERSALGVETCSTLDSNVFLWGSIMRKRDGIVVPPKDEVVIQDWVEFFLLSSFSLSLRVCRIFSTISDGLLLALPESVQMYFVSKSPKILILAS